MTNYQRALARQLFERDTGKPWEWATLDEEAEYLDRAQAPTGPDPASSGTVAYLRAA